jgi:hypothetical protein
MIKFQKRYYLAILIFFFILAISIRFFGEKTFLKHELCGDPMLWLHAASSQERLIYAANNKYCGVEIDTTFSKERGLISSYNKPDDESAANLKDLVANNLNIKYWWLDLKNLNGSNAGKISKEIENLSSIYQENIFLVESHNFLGLWFLNTNSESVYKVYWLAKSSKKNNKFQWNTPIYYLRSILANIIINPEFVSMFHYQVSNLDFLWVGNRQRFAFTINNLKEYENASNMGVYVILTDKKLQGSK